MVYNMYIHFYTNVISNIKIYKKSKCKKLFFDSIILIMGYLYSKFINIPLPWGIDVALIATFYMMLDNVLSQIGY